MSTGNDARTRAGKRCDPKKRNPTGEQHDHKTQFIKTAGVSPVQQTLAAPPCIAQEPIKWRMQTYAGPRWPST
jgi:hypothetical protein